MFQQAKQVQPSDLRARSAKALLGRLYRDISTLVEQEVELAKAEAVERGRIAVVAARSFSLSAVFGVLGLACLSACAVAALAALTGLWAAALIVGAAYGIAALVFAAAGRKMFAKATEPALGKLDALLRPVDESVTVAERHARLEWTRLQIQQSMSALERKTDIVAPLRDTALGLGSLGVSLSAIVRAGDGERG
jgi:hypothetical protein